jgi:DNA polymerase alpha-associated DNA helicase A
MTRLQSLAESQYSPLIRVLFGHSSPTPTPEDLDSPDSGVGKVEFIDGNLNEMQKEAIKFALVSGEIALIHGPPGVSSPFHWPLRAITN